MNPSTQQIFTEHLLCDWHSSRFWETTVRKAYRAPAFVDLSHNSVNMSPQEESVNDRFKKAADFCFFFFFFTDQGIFGQLLLRPQVVNGFCKSVVISSINLHFKISCKVICIQQNCRNNYLYEVLQEWHSKTM